jgi:serine/threonine protein kinase
MTRAEHRETWGYRILGVLGQGGHGRVYHAELQGPDQFTKQVALKLLRDEQVPDQTLQRFRDEARILGLLGDRAVIGVEPPIRLDGRTALVMEFVPGRSASFMVAQAPLPVTVVLEIIAEVARVLDRAWKQKGTGGQPLKLLHRDIKPSNIQLTPSGEVKVLDFGIAKAEFKARESKTTGHIGGTPGYIAPERLYGEEMPSGDVFSLGTVLRQLVTGQAPARLVDPTKDKDSPEVIDEVRTLWKDMTRMRPDVRPTAREVERRCHELGRLSTGPRLRDWAETHIPDEPLYLERDAMVGRVLTRTVSQAMSTLGGVPRGVLPSLRYGAGTEIDGGYRVVETVGFGDHSAVFRVHDDEAGHLHECALKLFSLDWSRRTEEQGGLSREALSLRHPNIVTCHELGAHKGQVYVTRSFMSGGRWTCLERRKWLRAGAGLADALHYAHGRGIFHGAVKPANLLVGDDGVPQLSDFGLPLSPASASSVGDFVAPEQRLGGVADASADQYSLALALLDVADLGGLDTVEHLSPTFGSVFRIALADNPQDRYPSCAEFAKALSQAADDVATAVPIPPSAEPPTTVANRAVGGMAWMAGGAALGAALVLAVAAGVWWGSGTQQPEPAPLAVSSPTPSQVEPPEPLVEVPPLPPGPVPEAAAPKPVTTAPSPSPSPSPSPRPSPKPSPPEVSPEPLPVEPAVAKPEATGQLLVNANPPSPLHVDGNDLGMTFWKGTVAVGPHVIELVHDGQSVQQRVDVFRDQLTTFCWDFETDSVCPR